MRTVHLKRGKVRPIQSGHAWVFAGSIDRVTGEGGDVVEVVGDRGDRLGLGLWSELSSIRVRMLGELHEFNDTVLRHRLQAAIELREQVGVSAHSDVFRVVNSEGDGLPGLSVDVFGDQLVTFQTSTYPMHARREAIAAALGELFADAAVLERPASNAIGRLEGFMPEEAWHTAPLSNPIEVQEYGVRFRIDPAAMQKTGHYADMREHRRWIGQIASNKRVLDAYCYTGGFALHAATSGAARVVALDSSDSAIAGTSANATLNDVTIETHVADTANYLRSAFDRGERFDIVILDPPKLAPSRKHAAKALKLYESLTVQAARLVDAHGLLCLGSCSEAIGIKELQRVFAATTTRLSRPTRVVRAGGQPCDHPFPAAMNEASYLSFVACALD